MSVDIVNFCGSIIETPKGEAYQPLYLPSFAVALVFCFVLLIVEYSIKYAFYPLGFYLATRLHGEKWTSENTDRIKKFPKYIFKTAYHCFVTFWAISILYQEQWIQDEKKIFEDWQGVGLGPLKSASFILYYLFQFGYSLKLNVSLIVLEEWQDDFSAMLIHHLIETSLIFVSYSVGLERMGLLVMLIHDFSDIPVSLSKLTHCIRATTVSVICFVNLIVFWIIARLYVLPVYLIRNSLHSGDHIINLGTETIGYSSTIFLYWLVIFLLVSLWLLHIYWFILFIVMAYCIVFKNEYHDLTEHSKGEKQETN